MANHLFVYFRTAERNTAAVLPRWQRWFDTVKEATGVTDALMRRSETRDGQATWMESYDDVLPVFAAILAVLWEAGGLREFVAGECHAELFVDLENN